MANNDNGAEKKQLMISHNSVGKTETTVVAPAKQTEVSPKGATEEAKVVPEEPPTLNNSGRSMTTENKVLLKKSPP